jgi:hypothetical protein
VVRLRSRCAAVIEDFESDESLPVDRRQAECFGTAFVDAFGYERLEDGGVSASNGPNG